MSQINSHDKADKEYYITANTILNLAKRAREIFDISEPQEKRQLLNFLLQNVELKQKNLLYKLKTPFDTVLQASKCSEMLAWQDSFRTFAWEKAFPDPAMVISQTKQLIALS